MEVAAGQEAPQEPRTATARIRRAANEGFRLTADLCEFFTNRRHARGGMYLPLVRVERSE